MHTSGPVLTFSDGHTVTFLDDESTAAELRMRHTWTEPARLAGAHWHPVLAETFTVDEGSVRFRLDGRTVVARPGDVVEVPPGTVHEFWNLEDGLVLDHRVRPPLQHRQMFEFWHRLDAEGRTTVSGLPRNPLDLAQLWSLQDGYIAKIPAWLQRLVLGRLSRLQDRRPIKRTPAGPPTPPGAPAP